MKKKLLLTFMAVAISIIAFGIINVSAATTVNVSTISALQSAHPYTNNMDKTWVYTEAAELDALKITFSEDTNVESYCDYIYILDSNDNQIGKYTGTALAGKTVEIPGNKIKIRLTSDGSGTEYGFKIDRMELVADGTVLASGTCGSKLTWKIQDNGLLTISGTGSMYNYTRSSTTGAVNHPWASKKTSITSIVIEDGVTSIGSYAFWWCYNVSSVEISDTVTTIGEQSFYDCSKLIHIDMGKKIQSVGSWAFAGCPDGATVNIRDLKAWCGITFADYHANPLMNTPWLCINNEYIDDGALVIPDGVTEIKADTFPYMDAIQTITIPKTVTNIDRNAFYQCNKIAAYNVNSANTVYASVDGILFNKDKTQLIKYPNEKTQTSYTIPNTVKTIGVEAFYGCDYLTSISLNSNLQEIDDGAFQYCSYLKNINLPDTVTLIGTSLFYGCSNLQTVKLSNSITEIPYGVFEYCSALTNITIPSSVKTIGNYAFSDCISLKNITIPASVTSIGKGVFWDCEKLEAVSFSCQINAISESMFKGCVGLKNVNIPSTVSSIEGSAFEDCATLRNITIPDCVTTIGESAFEGCTVLNDLTLPSGLVSLGSSAFRDCKGLKEIVIPNKLEMVTRYAFFNCTALQNVILGSDVTWIGDYTFYSCTSLEKITINKNLKSVYSYAFQNCALQVVDYGDTITKWKTITINSGNDMLKNCPNIKCTFSTVSTDNVNVEYKYNYLSSGGIAIVGFSSTADCSIIIPKTIEGYSVNRIENDAFENVKQLKNVIVPENVSYIGSGAFYGCSNLKNIVLPDSVSEIGSYAFAYCSSLEKIRIPNKVTDIQSYTFRSASKLKNIAIPKSVKTISDYAFDSIYDYDKTFNIYYGGSKTEWSNIYVDSFNNIIRNVKNIYYQSTSGIQDDLMWVVINDRLVVIGSNIPDYQSAEETPWYSYSDNIKNVRLDKNISLIGKYAFGACNNIQYILFDGNEADYSNLSVGRYNDVFTNAEKFFDVVRSMYLTDTIFYILDEKNVFTVVGNGAMEDYDFSSNQPYGEYRNVPTKVVVKSGITHIGSSNFAYFGNLTTVVLPDTITSIGAWTFEGCTKLKTINIPANLSTIPRSMFLSCSSITELEIPISIKNIEYAAFDDSGLNKIYYNDTEEHFKQITIGSYNNALVNSEKMFYANVTFYDKEGDLICNERQPMGQFISVDSVPFIYGFGIKLYKDSTLQQEYPRNNVINENVSLYVDYYELPLNEVVISEDSAVGLVGETVFKQISFATDKDVSSLYCFIKYPATLSLKTVTAKDFVYAGLEDEYTENGFKTAVILAQYSETELIPKNIILTPFELTFDISKSAEPGTVQIELTEESCLIGNETYFFEERIPGTLEILPKLAEGIEISGADVISTETTYTAIVNPDYTTDKSVEWSVDNEGVATISENGVVTPVTSGTVVLTATAKDGSGVTASKTITITRGVTNIEIIGADSITEATTYMANILPDYATNKEVEWSISNTEIATIDENGEVTPVTSGLITITATAKDGSGVSATKEINIIKLAETIEIIGEESISSPAQYTAIVSPDYTSDKDVSWSIDNEEIATVDELGIVTPVTSGTVILTAAAKDGSGAFATKTIEIVKFAESIEIVGSEEITEPTQYNVVILPEYTTNKDAEWTVSDETVATVDENGVVTPLKNGKIVLTVKALDASGIETTKSIVITVSVRANSITSDVGTWDKEFESDITEYTINVPVGTTAIYLTSSFTNATAKVNGTIAANGVRKKVSLTGNETNVEIVLTPTSGNNLKANTYTIKVVCGSFTKTTVSEDNKSFTITPINIENGKTVILALYNGGKFVEFQKAIYEGEEITFTTDKTYTDVKVMVWNDLINLKPVCSVEELN